MNNDEAYENNPNDREINNDERQARRKDQEWIIQKSLAEQLEKNPIRIRYKFFQWFRVKWRILKGIPCVHQIEPLDYSDWNNDAVCCMHCRKMLHMIMITESVIFVPVWDTFRVGYLYTAKQV